MNFVLDIEFDFVSTYFNLIQAYVVKGGINQHMISIIVEAYDTYVFNVFAYVYNNQGESPK